MDGYLSLTLDQASHEALIQRFPPVHQKVFAHHVTIAFKPDAATFARWQPLIGSRMSVQVYGYAQDEKGQAVTVDSDELSDRLYHVTISTDGAPPAYSKTLLEKGYETINPELTLQGTLEFVEHRPR